MALNIDTLTKLLALKYVQIADAKRVLGNLTDIRKAFIGFQPYLYDRAIA
jgi:hypothetical protein